MKRRINLLQRHPDLIGFYVCGGGMEGAISALAEEKMAGKLLVVVNELTPESRAALAEDLVTMAIATPLRPRGPRAGRPDDRRHRPRDRRRARADVPAVRHLHAGEYLTGRAYREMTEFHHGNFAFFHG